MTRRRRSAEPTSRRYSRMERVSELCRHIVADELERIDDDELDLVTVTHVEVEADLRHATVYYSALGREEDEVGAALGRQRAQLQRAIARQARLKRTPELRFEVDEVIRTGARVEEILRQLRDEREGREGP